MRTGLFLLTLMYGLQTEAQTLYILDTDEKLLGRITEDTVYTGPEQVAYTLRGQLIRSTQSDAAWLVDCDQFFGRKAGLVKTGNGRTVSYIIRKGSVFLGDHPVDERYERLIQLTRQDSSNYLVQHGLTGDTLGHIRGYEADAGTLFVSCLLYMTTFGLEQEVVDQLTWLESQKTSGLSAKAYPLMDTGPQKEWEWDGERFLFYTGGRLLAVWEYDGRRLRCLEGMAAGQEWTWESNLLRPSWDPDPQKQWTWIGENLQPYWGTNPDQMWSLSGNILRPTWNADTRLQWVVEGDFPLPALALIVLGYAR